MQQLQAIISFIFFIKSYKIQYVYGGDLWRLSVIMKTLLISKHPVKNKYAGDLLNLSVFDFCFLITKTFFVVYGLVFLDHIMLSANVNSAVNWLPWFVLSLTSLIFSVIMSTHESIMCKKVNHEIDNLLSPRIPTTLWRTELHRIGYSFIYTLTIPKHVDKRTTDLESDLVITAKTKATSWAEARDNLILFV